MRVLLVNENAGTLVRWNNLMLRAGFDKRQIDFATSFSDAVAGFRETGYGLVVTGYLGARCVGVVKTALEREALAKVIVFDLDDGTRIDVFDECVSNGASCFIIDNGQYDNVLVETVGEVIEG